MQDRKLQILQAIVKEFIQTAEPVGSNTLMVSYNFHVSPATIRNDMAYLEHEGLLFQPHTSAGRVPTDEGYREYVDKLIDYEAARKEAAKRLAELREAFAVKKVKEQIYDAVTLLTQATDTLSFATLASNRTFYLGLSNVLKQPEFRMDNLFATQVIEVMEDNDNFLNLLHNLPIDDEIKTFIGKENIFEKLSSCSLIVTKYHYKGYDGYIGLLGPTRTRYAYNAVCLEEIKKVLQSE